MVLINSYLSSLALPGEKRDALYLLIRRYFPLKNGFLISSPPSLSDAFIIKSLFPFKEVLGVSHLLDGDSPVLNLIDKKHYERALSLSKDLEDLVNREVTFNLDYL